MWFAVPSSSRRHPSLAGHSAFSIALLFTIVGASPLGAQSVQNAPAEPASYTAPLVRVIECPEEVAKQDSDVRFGAMIKTHVFSTAAATTLGFPAQAGRSLLLASAPLASPDKKDASGSIAIIDPNSGHCLKVLSAPAPMQVWKQGRMAERYDDFQFGRNFTFSPQGTRLFVGCTFGAKGFVLDLEKGSWTEITHPHMLLCRGENRRIVINNSARLSYGCKAVFEDETTLYLASNTLTYLGQSPGSLAPGSLLYKVTLGADGAVTSIADPHKPNPTPEELFTEEADPAKRGSITNRALYRSGDQPFGYFPAMDCYAGKLASTMFGVGDMRSRGVMAGRSHHFYAFIPANRAPVGNANTVVSVEAPSGQEGMPFIERRVPRGPAGKAPADCIAWRSSDNKNRYEPKTERFRPFHDFPGPKSAQLETMGVIDRDKEIGWVCSESFLGVFRWDGEQPQYRSIAITADGLQPYWRADYGALKGTEVKGWKMSPWTTLHVDATTGLLYIGQTGAAVNARNVKIHAGRIFVFDISKMLTELGWQPAA